MGNGKAICIGIIGLLLAVPAYAVPTSDDPGPPPGTMQLPDGGGSFIFPDFSGDEATRIRNDQILRAAIDYQKGNVQQAQERLDAIGLSFTSPTRAQQEQEQPKGVEQYGQRFEQVKQQEEQAQQHAEQQKKAAEDYHKQQMQHYLFNAIQKGHVSWIEHALKNGADVNTPYSGYTPVQYAASTRQLDAALYLIEKGAGFGTRENAYYTLLHQAAYLGHTRLIRYLINAKADVLVEDSAGKQAWEYARSPQLREALMVTTNVQEVAPGSTSASSALPAGDDPFAENLDAPKEAEAAPAQ